MATSRDRYYTEMFNTITCYNDCNNILLSNENIREAIRKVIEKESISDTNNVTAETFSHTSNTKRENVNAIFTNEKLYKSDDLAYLLEDLIINDAKYYESNSATSSDAQGDTTLDPETVTPISNRKEKVTDTNNGNFEQKLLSNRTILVVVLTMNLSIDPRIVPTVAVPQTLLTPETKEVLADAACDRA